VGREKRKNRRPCGWFGKRRGDHEIFLSRTQIGVEKLKAIREREAGTRSKVKERQPKMVNLFWQKVKERSGMKGTRNTVGKNT